MFVPVVVSAALFVMSASAINVRSEQMSASTSCECLNWQETYKANKIQCGQGFEMTRMLGYPVAPYPPIENYIKHAQVEDVLYIGQVMQGPQTCDGFYKRMNDTKCARVAQDSSPTEWWGKSWCYVPRDCKDAILPIYGPGKYLPAPVSVKLCEEGKDSLLSDMDPKSFVDYAKHFGFWGMNSMIKGAYPVNRTFYYDSAKATQIEALKASGKAVIVDKSEEHSDKMIIVGKKVYKFTNLYELTCVEGCTFLEKLALHESKEQRIHDALLTRQSPAY